MAFAAHGFMGSIGRTKRPVTRTGEEERERETQGHHMNKDHGVAIITGGASGIGLAIAKAAVGEGWKVLLADLTQPALDAAKAQIDAIKPGVTRTVVMDVAIEEAVVAGLKDCETGFGRVRGLVNSAGIGRQVPFFETSVKMFREILDINLVGTFAVAREAGKLMRANGGGAIVNVASVSGLRGNIQRAAMAHPRAASSR
jgi:NAD(P)-dependent dehydrogenase (short-subunit alcohol dehydrogenase family)